MLVDCIHATLLTYYLRSAYPKKPNTKNKISKRVHARQASPERSVKALKTEAKTKAERCNMLVEAVPALTDSSYGPALLAEQLGS